MSLDKLFTYHLNIVHTLLVSLVPRQSICSCRWTDHAVTRHSSSPSAACKSLGYTAHAGCQSLYPKLVASRYTPSWLPVASGISNCVASRSFYWPIISVLQNSCLLTTYLRPSFTYCSHLLANYNRSTVSLTIAAAASSRTTIDRPRLEQSPAYIYSLPVKDTLQ